MYAIAITGIPMAEDDVWNTGTCSTNLKKSLFLKIV